MCARMRTLTDMEQSGMRRAEHATIPPDHAIYRTDDGNRIRKRSTSRDADADAGGHEEHAGTIGQPVPESREHTKRAERRRPWNRSILAGHPSLRRRPRAIRSHEPVSANLPAPLPGEGFQARAHPGRPHEFALWHRHAAQRRLAATERTRLHRAFRRRSRHRQAEQQTGADHRLDLQEPQGLPDHRAAHQRPEHQRRRRRTPFRRLEPTRRTSAPCASSRTTV